MKKTILTSAFLAFLSIAVSANGQNRSKGKADSAPLPLQGKNLPEVTAVDSEGEPFPLVQKLKGRHGVIVFGCLT